MRYERHLWSVLLIKYIAKKWYISNYDRVEYEWGEWNWQYFISIFFLGRYQSSRPCWRIQNSHLCRLTNDMVARNRRSWHRQKRFGKLSSCSSHTCPLQKVAYKTLHDLASANNGLWACICPSRSCGCNIWSWLR